jgi:class 3 adenylate cyclase
MASADTWNPPPSDAGPAPVAFLTPVGAALPGLRVPLLAPSLTIGRDSSNGLCLPNDELISRRHCVVHILGSMLLIEDHSTNGTFVDSQRVHGLATVPVPSTIILGKTVLNVIPAQVQRSEREGDETISEETYVGPGHVSEPKAEALLLVDMVESTRIVMRDEPAYVELVLGIGRVLEGALTPQREPFIKCTGDGFCAAFPTASAALLAAAELDAWANRQRSEAVRLVIALHWGEAQRPTPGDRTGSAIRVLLDVDRLRNQVPALQQVLAEVDAGAMILMTDSLRDQLDERTRGRARPIGEHQIAGLDAATAVYWWPPRP